MYENQFAKYVQSQQWRHKDDMSEMVIVSLSLTFKACILRTQWTPKMGLFFKKIVGEKLKCSTGL